MHSVPQASILQALQWRYATKAFDPSRSIPSETWDALEASLVLTPSSFGLQPWKFIVVTDPDLKARLLPHCWNQRQVVDCSHLVVFCAKQDMDAAYIDQYIAHTASLRGTTPDALQGFRDLMAGCLLNVGSLATDLPEWATRQAYIALGQFMLAAALLNVDACPMEGFLPDPLNQELGLLNSGFRAVVLCPVGFRSPDDAYALAPKVRWPSSHVVEYRAK